MEKAYQLHFKPECAGGLSVNFCGVSKTHPLHSFGPAVKPHYIIHYVLDGKGRFSQNGKEYPLEKDYGFLICPDEAAFYQADEKEPWTYIWIGFDGTLSEEYLQSMGLSAQNPVFRCDKSDQLYQVVKDMMEHETYSVADELRRNGLLGIFLSIIAEYASIAGKSEEDKANQYVRKAVEYIQNNYCNQIKVTDIANYVCLNRSYLYTLFQNSLKMSPQEFLTVFRLTKAEELLQLTDLTIESIALSCGYSDPMVFTKAFQKRKKMSPSNYRKTMQKDMAQENKALLEQMEKLLNVTF